jgi:hypothetical protein
MRTVIIIAFLLCCFGQGFSADRAQLEKENARLASERRALQKQLDGNALDADTQKDILARVAELTAGLQRNDAALEPIYAVEAAKAREEEKRSEERLQARLDRERAERAVAAKAYQVEKQKEAADNAAAAVAKAARDREVRAEYDAREARQIAAEKVKREALAGRERPARPTTLEGRDQRLTQIDDAVTRIVDTVMRHTIAPSGRIDGFGIPDRIDPVSALMYRHVLGGSMNAFTTLCWKEGVNEKRDMRALIITRLESAVQKDRGLWDLLYAALVDEYPAWDAKREADLAARRANAAK